MAHVEEKSEPQIGIEVEDAVKNNGQGIFESPSDPDEVSRRKKLTRKILWKIDIRIIPLLAAMYLCCYFDRSNVGNAKILGLQKDLDLDAHKYGTALAVYYIFYILAELPSALLLKKVSPRIWLACLGCACGIVGMCLAFVRNYGGFVAVRLFLGLVEGGLLPGIVVYFSSMYTRAEIAVRIGVFYTASVLSGAFGGLLARGLSSIGPYGHVMDAGWRWIMLIEGLLTLVSAAMVYAFLPNSVATAEFLTPEERGFAVERLYRDTTQHYLEQSEMRAEKFSWAEVVRGVLTLQLWLTSLAYLCLLAAIYSFGLFLPSIIKDLGYTANAAQLWSVIPYAVATVTCIASAALSDRLRLRGPFMLLSLFIAIIGYATIANIDESKVHARYGMTIVIAAGIYSSAPPCISWNTNNSAGHYKRATTTGFQLGFANLGGFIGSFIYPSTQGPRYFESHTIIMSLLCFACLMVTLNILWCAKINRDKANGKYDQYIGYGDDRDPKFKMTL
ncbi:hypothetical protein H2200_012449 [Cladophialophora chaetospira]|uniref:Major facilitator superfamily (MFS) profile domain-containing protein n=1 Tax=Cladophialophora chaetospira TaxID=386627 RepID=A0AA39CCE8_9EURO|nr:hypothetical protein H2200_012449 [Cladophialophora chaetospira]